MMDADRPDFFDGLMGDWQFEREITGNGAMLGSPPSPCLRRIALRIERLAL